MKKGKFYLVFTVLFVILILIAGFNFIYHGPYTTQANAVLEAKQAVLEKNEMNEFLDFYQYNGNDSYYMARDEKNIYVFDSEYTWVKTSKVELINEELVKDTLVNQYGVEDFSELELGYENKVFAYVCRKKDGDKMQYIYLDATDASEIKVYELGK